jgi:putative heme-binding domain-containing protein
VEEYARFARAVRGDAARGKALFANPHRLDCARCHRVHGEGGDIGPDLSDIGAKFGRELLIESILEPSRQIVEGYRPTILAMVDGRVLSGILKGDSAAELTLVDLEGRRHSVRKSDIELRKIGDTSIMPAALAADLTRQEFTDVVAYLETLRSAGQGTPGSDVAGPIALPKGFTKETIATGITGATAMEVAPDGRIFICEQTGNLRIVKGGALLAAPFIKLEVDSQWERGLIGVALDLDLENDGYVYVNAVVPRPYPHHRLSRITAHGDVAVCASERVLFEGDDQTKLGGSVSAGHQGGAVHFGKDRKLYVAFGEQTAGTPAQAMDSLLGKLLRLNADGSIPEDNPFFRSARGKYRAIWALGLRNPFSFAVQPGTGRIFINDVGETRWEEINEGFAGANYGWPIAEGPASDPRLRGPVYHYPVASVAGGAFCPIGRDSGFGARFQGKYFFMDFVKGWIKVLDPDHSECVETFATGLTRPVDLKFAPDGSLYVLERDAWVIDGNFRPGTGSLLQIRAEPAPRARPRAAIAEVSTASSPRIKNPLKALTTNPHYFSDGTGKAIYLTGSHTWNNLQDWGTNDRVQPLDFAAYVNMLVKYNHNFTLLWSTELPTFHGLPTTANSAPDFCVTPHAWERTGPGNASDGKPKFDLTKFNQAYFARLRSRVEQLNAAGIYAGVYLFSGEWLLRFRFSGDGYPFTGSNNVNGIDDGGGSKSVTMAAPNAITAIQDAYVKKVIDTLNDLPNVLWIVSQEAPAESKWWNAHLIALIRSYESVKAVQHPIGYGVLEDSNDATIVNSDADWVAPAARISPTPSCGAGHPACKVNVNDSDHSYFGMWNDPAQTNRNFFWINFTNGNQTLFMDPYIVYYPRENRNLCPSPRNGIGSGPDRRWNNVRETMGYIRAYADRMNLAAMTPQGKLASTNHVLATTGSATREILVYAPKGGVFTVDLSSCKSRLSVEWLNAATGAKIVGAQLEGDGTRSLRAPFDGDAVLYLNADASSPAGKP